MRQTGYKWIQMKTLRFYAASMVALISGCQSPAPVTLSATGSSDSPKFPEMQVQNLTGDTKRFPAQFPGERTLLLIAFQREQQETLDDWNRRLGLTSPGSKIEWLEMPVIDDPGAFNRWLVDTGMRSGIPDPAVRARVFTVYAPRETFVRKLGLPDAKQVHLAVVDREGSVITFVSGPWSADAQRRIERSLPQP
jgi:hypothetical protein